MTPAEQRLRNNRDFRLVYAKGRSHVGSLAVLYVWKRPADSKVAVAGYRAGFVVSKKQGGAVERNRIKRRMREALRLLNATIKEGPYDLVFVGRSGMKAADWTQVQAAIAELLRRGGMTPPRPAPTADRTENPAGETGSPA